MEIVFNMKKIEFKANDVIVEGVVLTEFWISEYVHNSIVYAQNRLVNILFAKYDYMEDIDGNIVFTYDQSIEILEEYCVLEGCENFLKTNPPIEESYIGNW